MSPTAEPLLAGAVRAAVEAHPILWLVSVGEVEDGWVRAPALGDSEVLAGALERVGADAGVIRRDVLAQWMAEWLGWIVGQPAVALLAAQRRVPVFEPADLAVLLMPNGRPGGVRVGRGRVYVAADDPERDAAEAVVLDGGVEALAAAAVAQVAAAIAPAVATLARLGRRAPTALWRGASDRVAAAFAAEGAAAGTGVALLDLGRAALAAPGPLRAAPEYREVAPHGLLHLRRGCCLVYTGGDEKCLTCPLLDDAQRAQRAA